MSGPSAMQARIDALTVLPVREARMLAPLLWYHAQLGQRAARRQAEVARLDAVRAGGAVPDGCGPEIAAAPARGAVRAFAPMKIRSGSAGTLEHDGYRGPGEAAPRRAIRRLDVFDRMIADAESRHARQHPDAAFVPPFSPGQVQAARAYAWLVERHAAGGMRCASLEAQSGGGGGAGGAFIDAYVAEGRRIERLRAAIGGRAAMAVRRVRPSDRGSRSATIISDRALVDAVCLGQQTLSGVLQAHGWSACAAQRERLRQALAGALDRMQGYGRAAPQDET